MSLIKKIFQTIYYLTTFFLLFYIFFIWFAVLFSSSGPARSPGPGLLRLGKGIGITPGDIELAFYASIPFLLIFFISILGSLIIFRKTQSKINFFKRTSLITTAIYLLVFIFYLIIKFFYPSAHPSSGLFFYFISNISIWVFIIPFLFTYLVYLFFIWIFDKKWRIHLMIYLLIILILIVSFILPFKLYMASGCNNYQDTHCVGRLAASKNDVSFCEKSLEIDKRTSCLDSFIAGQMKTNLFKNREIKDVEFCSTLNLTLKVRGIASFLSMQAYCFERTSLYFQNVSDQKEICAKIENIKEKEHCIKTVSCLEIPVGYDEYGKCISEAENFLK
ncbi:MAG: hypothetical protein HYW34_02135 [Candidatus Brennerbacteria bacterium]|nr:hypothetical protein [Candidatus Brennerbacteria bacterium]